MQRGKHQVTGQRGLNAHADGFLVAHFADHDDVRVGSQKGAHRRCEVQAALAVDLYLAQPLLGDFDRIFGSPYLGVRLVQEIQDRVQGGGLSRAGRTTHEKQAVRLADYVFQTLQVMRQHTQLVQRDRFAGSQDAHYDVFDTACRWDRRDPQFDIERAVFLELDFSVLGFATL